MATASIKTLARGMPQPAASMLLFTALFLFLLFPFLSFFSFSPAPSINQLAVCLILERHTLIGKGKYHLVVRLEQ
jgi:hypothetical protein